MSHVPSVMSQRVMAHTHAGIVVAAFLWSAPIALMSAELGTIVPENGGAMVWARAAFGAGSCRGDAIAFCAGVMQHVAACCSMLQHVAACCSFSWRGDTIAFCVGLCSDSAISENTVAVSYSVLQCVAVCCSVLQCVAVCGSVLQCVAVRCSALQCVVMLPCVAGCCSLLQGVAVCCRVLQSVAV